MWTLVLFKRERKIGNTLTAVVNILKYVYNGF